MQNSNEPINTKNIPSDVYEQDNDIFDDSNLVTNYDNQRKSVRYVRKDITAFISQADIFGTYSLFGVSRAIRVKLLNISSRGALIGGPSKLVLMPGQKLKLTLIFKSNKNFEIPAHVMHELINERKFYGLKFDAVNDPLADYLLESQSDLIFK